MNREGSLDAGFQQVPLSGISTILLWSINNLKFVKKSKKLMIKSFQKSGTGFYSTL